MDEYIDQYANTQVTKLLFNVNYLRACYESEVMTPYWDVPDPSTDMTDWPRKYWQINKKGIDLFDVCIKKSRLNNISPWLSLRMNDHHYREDPARLNKLMLEKPELRLSSKESFDYGKEEVREYYKAFIAEAIDKYNVDGIELDWMRTFYLFKPGEEKNGMKLINDFMKDIREITKKQSRNIQIAARVPISPVIGRKYGLDAIVWAKEGSVDIIIPTNYWYPTKLDIPVEKWKAELGENSSCIIAPGADLAFRCIEDGSSIVMHNSIETMRAFAINAYTRGAGAVYLFNHFDWVIDKWIYNHDGKTLIINDKPSIIKEGGRIETVLGKPRIHVLTFASPDTGKVKAKLPRLIYKENSTDFQIYTGPKPVQGKYIVRLGLDTLIGFNEAVFNVDVNGIKARQIDDLPRSTTSFTAKTNKIHVAKNLTEVAKRVLQFEAVAENLNDGYNTIEVGLESKLKQKVIWLEIYVH